MTRSSELLALESTIDASIALARFGSGSAPLCIAERFHVDKVVGTGAFGVVVRARDTLLGRTVALKCIPASNPHAMREQLAGEAQALTKVRAPEVVVVFDFIASHLSSSRGRLGMVAIVMEYVPALNLREWARQHSSSEARLDVLSSAARGLEAAHAAGVVHRDFKPENVLVDEQGGARLVDFGLAYQIGQRSEGAALARSGELGVGTPGYMAPELLRGQVSPSADQYAFAVTAWELLTGRRPFEGGSELAQRGQPRDYAGAEHLSVYLLRTLGRALRPSAEQRFSSLAQLRQALESSGSTLERIMSVVAGTAAIGAIAATAYHAGKKHHDKSKK